VTSSSQKLFTLEKEQYRNRYAQVTYKEKSHIRTVSLRKICTSELSQRDCLNERNGHVRKTHRLFTNDKVLKGKIDTPHSRKSLL